jgi:HAD superfamily hydrolase (TIGR01490 family)
VSAGTAARSAYAHAIYLLRGADHVQMERMKQFLTELVTGWDVAAVSKAVDSALDEVLMPTLHAEAAELIRWHADNGRDVVIVTSSAEEIVRPIADRLGVHDVLATRMQVADGRYTGIIDFYCYGPAKADAIHALADERGYRLEECYGYSDSFTDLAMLSAVGRPHAVNPDRRLHDHARMHGWPVLHFQPPQAAVNRLMTFSRPPAAAIGAAAGAVTVVGVTAGAGWLISRRRKRRRLPPL